MLVHFLFNFGIFVMIWMVQLIVYPSFRYVDEKEFTKWHASYTTRISFVVIPLMFGQVGMLGFLLFTNGGTIPLIAQAVLVSIAWLSTFLLSVPCHNELSKAKNPGQIERLVSTNWIRTVAWSLVVVIDVLLMNKN